MAMRNGQPCNASGVRVGAVRGTRNLTHKIYGYSTIGTHFHQHPAVVRLDTIGSVAAR
jgi:hypothetical protein